MFQDTQINWLGMGIVAGAVGWIVAQSTGLADCPQFSDLIAFGKGFGASAALLGNSHAFTTAACYGDGSLCTSLLTAFDPKQFQQISALKRSGRMLFVPGSMALSKTAARAAKSPVAQAAPTMFAGGMAQPGARPAPFLRQAARGARAPRSVALQMSVGLYFSTTTGNTETVAGYLADLTGVEAQDPADVETADMLAHDAIIVGAPTWHTGADTERSGTSWDEWLYNELPNMDFTGKKVAIFGVGDSNGYGENFCDATGELYDCFTKQGATVIGMTSSDKGFDYEESKGVVDGKFVGMPFDEDNYSDESEERAKEWVEQLKTEGLSV
jgi:flavodoxin I